MFSDLGAVPAVPVKVTAALCAVLLLSCTVKEDRTECPCFLTFNLGGVEAAGLMEKGIDSMVLAVRAGMDYYAEEAFALRDNVQEYSLAVPKSQVDVLIACGAGVAGLSREGFRIPEGSECPALYMSSDSFSADADEMRRTVTLHRNYCTLTVSMKSSFNVLPRPYRILLEGNVAGYSMDGTPEEGVFSCFSPPSSGGLCRLNVPRQKDGSLRLVVYFQDSGEVRSFPVGEYILESGYDWSSPDLEDISVEMDFSRTGMTVSITKWKKTLSFDITF